MDANFSGRCAANSGGGARDDLTQVFEQLTAALTASPNRPTDQVNAEDVDWSSFNALAASADTAFTQLFADDSIDVYDQCVKRCTTNETTVSAVRDTRLDDASVMNCARRLVCEPVSWFFRIFFKY